MNKDLIHTRFTKTLASYNENARIQKRMAERLFSFLKKKNYSSILEIGCGTGFLTELASKNLEFETYKAIDIVEDCKEYISEISSRINFTQNDVETYIKDSSEKFDLIISNAALQWVENFEEVINRLKSMLKPDGELLFSTFGKENFKEISCITGTSLKYYSPSELEELFPKSFICPEIHIMAFKTARDVLTHLKLTGVNAIENTNWTKKDLQNFEKTYSNLCPGRITLTYNPIYIHINL